MRIILFCKLLHLILHGDFASGRLRLVPSSFEAAFVIIPVEEAIERILKASGQRVSPPHFRNIWSPILPWYELVKSCVCKCVEDEARHDHTSADKDHQRH